MAIQFSPEEILETIRMVQMENLDIRTITMGISLRNCADPSLEAAAKKAYEKICRSAARLVAVGEEIEREYGIPIINKRVSVTPIALVAEASASDDYVLFAEYLDRAAAEVGVNFLGGFSALVHKGTTPGDAALIASLPEALARTERVCASINVATTRAGINMDAVARMGEIIVATAKRTADRDGIGCAKLVVFCNAVEDNPFMAGAFHGIGEPDCVINVGVSGPGVVANAVEAEPNADFGALASIIKRTAFKITRMGELVGRAASEKLGVPFGIVDLSLAPTPAPGDSVARVLEAMGLERIGTHGSTAALALLNDAVKKGGAMASSYVGGLSGAFIPVSEDVGDDRGRRRGHADLRQARSDDLRLLRRPRHDRRARRHAGRDDRRDHRRRSRDRHDQPQDDGRALDSRRPARKSATSCRSAACSAARPSSRCIANRARRSSRAAAEFRRRCKHSTTRKDGARNRQGGLPAARAMTAINGAPPPRRLPIVERCTELNSGLPTPLTASAIACVWHSTTRLRPASRHTMLAALTIRSYSASAPAAVERSRSANLTVFVAISPTGVGAASAAADTEQQSGRQYQTGTS